MTTNKILTAAVSLLMMSGVACSKKHDTKIAPKATEAVNPKVEKDCSALMSSWNPSEKQGNIETLTFYVNNDGITTFSFSGKGFYSPLMLVNGETSTSQQGEGELAKSYDFKGSCVDGSLILDSTDLSTKNVESIPSDNVLDVKRITFVTSRWIITPDEGSIDTATLKLQEVKTTIVDDPKDRTDGQPQEEVKDISSVQLTKAVFVNEIEQLREEQRLMREAAQK
jgi:hypothetical protein